MRRGAAAVQVGLVVAALLGACTRVNPSFGDKGRASDEGDGEGVDDEGVDDDDDDDGGTTTADGGVDEQSSITEEGEDSTAHPPESSTGQIEGCELPEHHAFDVLAIGDDRVEIDRACEVTVSWIGAVLPGASPDEMVVAVCPDNSCGCAELAEPVTISFSWLEPSPVDAVAGEPDPCVQLSVARRSEALGCGVEWISMERAGAQSDFPMYMAASTAEPSWSLYVAGATLGEPLQVCDPESCGETPPGDYELFLGEHGPIAPTESVEAELNPYAGMAAPYDVTSLFARIDDACERALGWAAIPVPE